MQAAWTQGWRQAVGWRQKGGGRVGGAEDKIPVYIARVARWAFTGLKISGPKWSSAGYFWDPPQTRRILGTRTRKSAGLN